MLGEEEDGSQSLTRRVLRAMAGVGSGAVEWTGGEGHTCVGTPGG